MAPDVPFLQPTNSSVVSYAMHGMSYNVPMPDFRVTADLRWDVLWQDLNPLMAASCAGMMNNHTALKLMRVCHSLQPCNHLLAGLARTQKEGFSCLTHHGMTLAGFPGRRDDRRDVHAVQRPAGAHPGRPLGQSLASSPSGAFIYIYVGWQQPPSNPAQSSELLSPVQGPAPRRSTW